MTIFKETQGQGHEIVILHGWACDHRHMQPIVEQLAKHYRVLNYDLPGRGGSDWAENTSSIDDIADQLLPELPKKAIYIGWSFGGLVTTSIAARYPERVERYIGIGSIPKFIEDENWPAVRKPGFRVPFNAGIDELGFKGFLTAFYDNEFGDAESKPKYFDHLVSLLDEPTPKRLDVLFQGIDICDAADLRLEFSQLTCPIDLIIGDQDDCAPVAVHPMVKALNSRVNIHLISGAVHMPFWTHPEDFSKCLRLLLGWGSVKTGSCDTTYQNTHRY